MALDFIKRYRIRPSPYVSRVPKRGEKTSKKTPVPANYLKFPYCPFLIPTIPKLNEEDVKHLGTGTILSFFHCEAWLRSPALWNHVRRNASENDYIGGVPVRLRHWLLAGGHHILLKCRADTPVTDMALELISTSDDLLMRHGLKLSEKDAGERLGAKIVDAGRSLRGGQPSSVLFLEIDLMQEPHEILGHIEQMIAEYQAALKAIPIFRLLFASPRRRPGPSDKWTTWAKRIQMWDKKKANPKLTNLEIGEECFGCNEPEPEKKAVACLHEATIMIRAAESGNWPPQFPRYRRRRRALPAPG